MKSACLFVLALAGLLLCVPETEANGGLFSRSRSRVRVVNKVQVNKVRVVEQVQVQKVVQVQQVQKVVAVQRIVAYPVIYPPQAYYSAPLQFQQSYQSDCAQKTRELREQNQLMQEQIRQLQLQQERLRLQQPMPKP